MPKVKAGDINMYYEVHGKGEPLVNIPGAGGTMDGFYRHIPVYARKYKLVAYDPRGAGRTDAPDIPYTTEMMADDLAGLLDAIGIDSAHIMGASMGGMIAQQFALRYPQRVRSLVLACTKFGGPHEIPVDAEILDYWEHPKQLSPEDSIMQGLRLQMSQEFIDNNPSLIKELITKVLESPPPVNPQSGMRQVQAILGHNTYDRLPEIKAPTLIIHGEADNAFPLENAHILASRIPNAELAILKNAGHLLLEAGDELNRLVLDFLRRHSAKNP